MFEICYFSSAARTHESDFRRLNFPQVQRNCIMLVVTFNALGRQGCSEALKAVCETKQWCRGGNPWNWREMQCHCGCLCHGHAGSLKKGSQHELSLKMAEVFLGCFVTGRWYGAPFWPGCKSWSQIHRVVVSPLGLEIPLQVAEAKVQARAIGFGPWLLWLIKQIFCFC